MDYSVQVKVATISLWNYAAIILHIIAFIMLYMKANKNASLKAFFLVQFSMLVWLTGKVFKTVSPTEDLRWAFIVFYYFGICLLEVSFLDFAYIYNKGKAITSKLRLFIYLVALIQFVIVLTNPYHSLFYSEYSFWGDDFGPLFYVHLVINYGYIITGMVYCSTKFNRQVKYKGKLRKYLVSLAILLPIIFNFIYISGILHKFFRMLGIQIFDITPLVFTWSILVFVYATYKYEFFDLTPIMKHEVTHRLDTPILIIDSAGDIIFVNKQLKLCFDLSDKYEQLKGIIEEEKLHRKDTEEEGVISHNSRYYRYNARTLKSINGTQHIITFNDITSYELAKNELYIKNTELDQANKKLESQIEMLKQTSHIGARNYVARELHDIIGHSLVVTMKLLEVSKVFYNKNTERVIESLEKAKGSVKSGFEQMKEITARKEREIIYNSSILERELRSMHKAVEASGTKVSFYIRGEAKKLDERVFDIIKRVSTELVTNTLKHAKADKIFLSISFSEKNIDIQFMDNGRGSNEIVKGNGLMGIDSRLELIGGSAEYKTNINEGFVANIIIKL